MAFDEDGDDGDGTPAAETTADDTLLEGEIGRDDTERRRQIRDWAEYVRTHPDEEWGRQVNAVVESHLEHARARQFDRPDLAHLRDPAAEDNDIQRPPIARKSTDDDTASDDPPSGAGASDSE